MKDFTINGKALRSIMLDYFSDKITVCGSPETKSVLLQGHDGDIELFRGDSEQCYKMKETLMNWFSNLPS
jgi:hypothetical protein